MKSPTKKVSYFLNKVLVTEQGNFLFKFWSVGVECFVNRFYKFMFVGSGHALVL